MEEEDLNMDSELLNSDSDEEMAVDSLGEEAGTHEHDVSDDDDDEDDDENDELLIKYMEALGRINKDKYRYDEYLSLVEAAHALEDLDKIRESCELFSSVYPLTPEIWIRWLGIELSIATTAIEYERLHQQYQRALSDYYSSKVALEYASLAAKPFRAQEIWEFLIPTYALHCMEGRHLFEARRKHFVNSESESAEKRAKLVLMYEEELQLPLHGMEDTYIEFKVLCERASLDDPEQSYVVNWSTVDERYEAAKQQLQKCMPFEQRLLELETSDSVQRALIYEEYIAAGKSFLDDRIVHVLYERMVTEACLDSRLWLSYVHYITRRKDGVRNASTDAQNMSAVFGQTEWDVCNRALRNCTWSVELYVEKLNIAERMAMSRDEMKTVAEEALAAGFRQSQPLVKIWLEYLAYMRRSSDLQEERDVELLRATFTLACNSLEQQFGDEADVECEIHQFWGRLEYGVLGDVCAGKELWTTVLQSGWNQHKTALWMEFVQLEMQHRSVDGARKIFRKAVVVSGLDDPNVIASAWVRFERCHGTLEQLKTAQRICNEQLAKVEIYHEPDHRNGHKEKTTTNTKRNLKRKATTDGHNNSNKRNTERRAKEAATSNRKSISMGPPASKTAKFDVDTAEGSAPEPHEIDTAHDDCTIFLSNLAYATTEADIRSAFPEMLIEDVTIIKSANGNSRGFGYVRLAAAKQVELSLTFDRRPINGRPVFVSSVLRDKEQRKKFKFSTDCEPSKLFVKGLAFETTKEEIAEAFGAFGAVKDVRLVCHRNGKSKGLAYVDYEHEKSATVAIMKMDQTELAGFKISVALSAPPPKSTNTGAVSAAATLGHGKRTQTARGDVKPRLSFIPRAVLKNSANAAISSAAENTTAAAVPEKTTPKTNADFRKLLTQDK